jgi:hypothetical protein
VSHDLRSDLADPSAYGRQQRDALEEAIVALKAAEEYIARPELGGRQEALRRVQAALSRLDR